MQDNTSGYAYSWDSPIENDGEERTLLAGEVDFTVLKFERTKSEKLNCPMAILTIEISNDEGRNIIFDYLILNSKFEWKLCQFFTGIGQRARGEKLDPLWDDLPGSTGRCRVVVENYTRNNREPGKSNKIKAYLAPLDPKKIDF